MKPGPKPKPTELKRRAGNPGGRPLNIHEPQPGKAKPRCPVFLSPQAKREWKKALPKLYDAGLLTEIDGYVFGLLCEAWASWQGALVKLRDTGGAVLVSRKTGSYYQNPWVHERNKAFDQFLKLAAEFGMTPSARSRIRVSPEKDKSLAEVLFET